MMDTQAMETATAGGGFSVSERGDGIVIVSLDIPGERMNTLRGELVEQANELFDELARSPGLTGVIFISGKPDSFIAGADVHALAACHSADEAQRLSELGQAFCNRLETFSVPVVAAIHGICLGGGLELAMACRGRVASNDPKTQLGLPEVKLGLLPGSGGTQRLAPLTGLQNALDLLLTGRQIGAAKARRIGLVHDVVPAPILLRAAVTLVRELAGGKAARPARPGAQRWLLEGNPLGRALVFRQARKTIREKTRGNYPAPDLIIDCVQAAYDKGRRGGLEVESRNFGKLAMTAEARQLMGLYFATQSMKKDPGTSADVEPGRVRRAAVLGAGLMGAGISFVTAARAETPVRLKDISNDGLNRGMQYVDQRIGEQLKRRAITPLQATQQLRRVTPTLDWSGFGAVDLVLEAVFEDLALKHRMLRDVEANCPEHTIFASNTSSLPISRIAEAARRPGNVIGMHYFSPVEKMPLLEIIAGPQTAPEVIATTVAFGRRQGKTPIVVGDGAGFYVNRILAPYLNEASRMLEQGVAISDIDQALVQFGFPVGPFALLDEVGLDVADKVATILHQAFGERMRPAAAMAAMLNDQRLGRKNSKGFYDYSGRGRKSAGRRVDTRVYKLLAVKPQSAGKARSADQRADQHAEQNAEQGRGIAKHQDPISHRCVLMLLNEAARCLDEGILRSARDGDIGAVFGIGFPPFLGGPFRYMDTLGIATVARDLDLLARAHGERFKPADVLVRMAQANRTFHTAPDQMSDQ